jgi:hypothetical protein
MTVKWYLRHLKYGRTTVFPTVVTKLQEDCPTLEQFLCSICGDHDENEDVNTHRRGSRRYAGGAFCSCSALWFHEVFWLDVVIAIVIGHGADGCSIARYASEVEQG